MAEDGSVLIKILGDASEFEKSLDGIAGKGAALLGKGFAAVTAGITAAGAASVKVGMNFESSMSQVAATMGITTEEIANGSDAFETMKQAAKDAGATTAFSATESAEALNYLALAGYDAEKAAEVLPSVLNLAAAGSMDLAYASDLVTDSMSALGIEATKSNVDEFGDKMAKTASKANTGVSQLGEAILTVGGTAKDLAGGTTELNTVLGILADNGIKGSEGGTALRNMILSLEAPTDKAAGQMEALGLAVFDANGEMRPMQDIMADLNKAMANMTSGERTQALNTIFNKVDLKSVNALLGTSTERWNELSDAIDNSTGAMQSMADVQLDNLEGDITLLQSAMEGLGITAYESVSDPLRDAVQAITEFVGEVADAFAAGEFDDLMDGVADAIESIVKLIKKAGKVVLKIAPAVVKAVGLVADVFSELLDHIDLVVGAIAGFGGALAALKISSLVPKITSVIKTLVVGIQTIRTVGMSINGVCGALEVMGVTLTASTAGLGAIVIAAAGAAAAIAAFAIASSDTSKTTTESIEATEALCDEYDELHDSIEENRKAREKNTTAMDQDTALAENYAQKIEDLAGKENKSAEEKKLMAYYVGKLNDIMPDLNLQYDEEADKLSDSTEAIYDNIEARKEQAKLEAYNDNYSKAVAEGVELEAAREDLEAQKIKALSDVDSANRELRSAVEKERNGPWDAGSNEAQAKLNNAKKALDDLNEEIEKNSEDLKANAAEQEKWADKTGDLEAARALREAFSDLQKEAKEAGVAIPESVSDGILEGRYAVPESVDELENLVAFDAMIQEAGLQGVEVPESLAKGVYSGETSVEDAVQRLKDVVEFDELAAELKLDGSDGANGLRDGLLSGEVSVDTAIQRLKDAAELDELAVEMGADGSDGAKGLRDGLLSGEITLEEASKQLAAAVEENAKPDLVPPAKMSAEGYEQAFRRHQTNAEKAGEGLGEATASGVSEGSEEIPDEGDKQSSAFVTAFESKKKAGANAGGALGSSTTSALKSATSGIPPMGGQVITGFNSGMLSKSGAASGTAGSIGSGAKSSLSSSSSKTNSIGSNMISGMISGMGSMAKTLYEKARSLVSGALEAMKKKLRINSPSKVFRDQVGESIPEGVAVGIEQGTPDAVKAAEDSVAETIKAANAAAAKGDIDMSGLVASIPEAKKIIAANTNDIAAQAKAAVQYEMDRRAASIPAYNTFSMPAYDDGRVVALLGDLLAVTREGKTIMVNQRAIGQTVRQWEQKMERVTGGA